MDVPVQKDDPLAQPTRARLFALLGGLRRSASTEELASELEMHPNGVRAHLERLAAAGLVMRDREQPPRGRPRDVWQVDPGARPGGRAPTGYAELSRWLARALESGDARAGRVEDVGKEIGRELGQGAAPGDAESHFFQTLVSLGFQPRREAAEGGVKYCLANCPYREAVRENQPLVCGLHRGMTSGLLEVLEPAAELTGFVPHDPDVAGCEIEVAGAFPAEGAGA